MTESEKIWQSGYPLSGALDIDKFDEFTNGMDCKRIVYLPLEGTKVLVGVTKNVLGLLDDGVDGVGVIDLEDYKSTSVVPDPFK